MDWTYPQAERLLNRYEAAFADCDLAPRIIGSVLTKGHSDNDLDILLSPTMPMSLGDGINRLERLLPQLDLRDMVLNPSPDTVTGWFANALTPDNRSVEFYFPESDFPIEEESQS